MINGAEKSILAGISEIKTSAKEGAKQQAEPLQQQGFDWPRFGAYLTSSPP